MKTALILALTFTAWPALGQDELEPSKPAARKSAPAPASAADQASVACPVDGTHFLPMGFTFPALLPDAIFSYNTNAPTISLVEDDVKFRNLVVLPKGTRLVGTVSTLQTLDRVNIIWSRAVLPQGCEYEISALALSADDGSAGIKGKVEKHEDSIAARVALKSVLAAGSAAAAVAAPLEGAVAGNLANEGTQIIDQDLAKVKSLTSIYVHERKPIRVLILRRFVRDAAAR